MTALLYIHGFLSSPQSYKAVQVQRWLAENRPDIEFLCPALSPYPNEAKQTLLSCIAQASKPVGVIGSSLGGFWATWLGEQLNLRAVLVNPSVNPMAMFPNYMGQKVKNYHSEESYLLTQEHLLQLRDVDTPRLKHPENYWLLAQMGDEVLDYRLAEKKYGCSKQCIEQGGDHGFQNFERHIEASVHFLFNS